MIQEDFDDIVSGVIQAIVGKTKAKGREYGRETDRLHNFKRAAVRRGITPEAALLGFKEKHSISINDMIDDLDEGIHHPISVWREKLWDEIIYNLCLEALVVERQVEKKPIIRPRCEVTAKKKGGEKR